jgi:hypothetical protein
MQRTFKPTDRGKQVLDEDDHRVGTITGVAAETARVRPEGDAEELGGVTWADDGESFCIHVDDVARIGPVTARLAASVRPSAPSSPTDDIDREHSRSEAEREPPAHPGPNA